MKRLNYEKLGRKLQAVRNDLGLTTADVFQQTGLACLRLEDIEKGSGKPMVTGEFALLSQCYQIPMDLLIELSLADEEV